MLQERLAKLTDIHAGDQLILWSDKELSDVIDTSRPVYDFPRSVRKGQLFLVSRTCMDSNGLKSVEIRMFTLSILLLYSVFIYTAIFEPQHQKM